MDYVIQPQQGKKGRSFQSKCLGLATAYSLFPEGLSGQTIRPVWAMFVGTENELKPFMANLRLGRKAEPLSSNRGGDADRLEFLKSVSYQVSWQKEVEGCVATIYHTDLFHLDPGMVDPEGIQFVLMSPPHWRETQDLPVEEVMQYNKDLEYPMGPEWVPTAYLFAAYIDRRTRCPLIADGRFYWQLLGAALDKGLASFSVEFGRYYHQSAWGKSHTFFSAFGLDELGLHALSFTASHETFEDFLADQVSLFFERVGDDMTSIADRIHLDHLAQEILLNG